MRALHVTLDDSGRGTVICPRCGADIEVVIPDHMLRHDTPLRTRVRCESCGLVRATFVERRAAARRDVDLEGVLLLNGGNGHEAEYEVRINDLSRFGLSFEAPEDVDLDPGQQVEVMFELNPGRRQSFRKAVEIRWVEGSRVGAELAAKRGEDPYDPVYDLALAQHQGHPATP